ncbi:MAG: alkaline phosphatase D family protein [Rhodospirillaceae bacterium]
MALTRREFLAASAAAALCPSLACPQSSPDTPFALGIASGYPHARGCTLWTRLIITAPASRVPADGIPVAWEIARDEFFHDIALRGESRARPAWGYSVHVDVDGLESARWYWYRFTALGARSPVGRTRTAPHGDAARLKLAFASCQQYEQGYYAAYRHMAREPLDMVVHLGDYIYESSWGRQHVRSHGALEPVTLEEYRARYALYKSDPDLQAAHAACPWIVTWDDHEVQNDYANDRSERLEEGTTFLARRAAAYQAYYEHMPLPAWARPQGAGMQLYTRVPYGGLASFHVLDSRQYKSHQVCPRAGYGGGNGVAAGACPERLDAALTFLGTRQEQWLHEALRQSTARWNIVAQQTLMAQCDRGPGAGQEFWTDGWDGYPKARERLLRELAERRVSNPVVISGDVHMAVVADLKVDFDNTRAPVVATEFCGTSISSQGPSRKRVETIIAKNPHIKLANAARRGYTVLEITRERCTATFRALQDVRDPESGIFDLARYALEDGKPGAQRA